MQHGRLQNRLGLAARISASPGWEMGKIARRTVSKDDVCHGQESLTKAHCCRGLDWDVTFAFHPHGNHGDDHNNKDTQEC